jgi:hypothetical protein
MWLWWLWYTYRWYGVCPVIYACPVSYHLALYVLGQLIEIFLLHLVHKCMRAHDRATRKLDRPNLSEAERQSLIEERIRYDNLIEAIVEPFKQIWEWNRKK